MMMKKKAEGMLGSLMVKIAIGIAVLALIALFYFIISGNLEGVKAFFGSIWWFGD